MARTRPHRRPPTPSPTDSTPTTSRSRRPPRRRHQVEGAGQLGVVDRVDGRRGQVADRRPGVMRHDVLGALDDTSGRCPRARSGGPRGSATPRSRPQRRAVRQRELAEHGAGPERRHARRSWPGRRPAARPRRSRTSWRSAVDEDDERQVRGDAVRARPDGASPCRRRCARCRRSPLIEELARDPDGLVDVAARVAAQVEDEPVGAGRLIALRARRSSSAAPFENWSRRISAVVLPGTIVHDTGLDRHVGADDRVRSAPGRRAGPDRQLDVVPASPRTQPATSSRSCPVVAWPSTAHDHVAGVSPAFSAGLPSKTPTMRGGRPRSRRSGRRSRHTSRTARRCGPLAPRGSGRRCGRCRRPPRSCPRWRRR